MGDDQRNQTDSEGTGSEQGLDEHSGLQDKAAKEGRDTAAALQDTSAAPRPES